ncbi:MAG: M20/M25/M40 family metallo-hydrolase [Candidatus Obscuribacterales bacterium]|nr:M20/M25/M40 family metallo-hydrolase [Candidatus Obscuribacterales bacterium]
MPTDIKEIDLNAYAESCRQEFETALKTLVDIPSVSVDPNHKSDINRCAETAQAMLHQIGAQAEIIKTKGNPLVFGQLGNNPGYPTVLIYNHLDVQPADAEEWETNPFEMLTDNGKYIGRGSTDDKGPALAVLFAAKYAAQNQIPINIKFLWELEEEIGSPNFEQALKENKDKFKTDSIAVSDTIWISRERPAVGYGLRGLQGALVRLKTGKKDIHSGLAGGLARNPIAELAQVISKCFDAKSGKVLIPGFYDAVRKISESDGADFLKSGFTVNNFKKDHELNSTRTDDDLDGAKRIWALPTFEVHGITGGYSGPGVKTIVPHKAEAKISMRLVPDQDPDKIFALLETFIKSECPDAEVIKEGSLHPYMGSTESREANAARQAMKTAFGKDPAFVREGGSIGAVLSMKNVLGYGAVFLGLSLPEHGYHAINENFDWHQASGGIKMFVHYFQSLANLK